MLPRCRYIFYPGSIKLQKTCAIVMPSARVLPICLADSMRMVAGPSFGL